MDAAVSLPVMLQFSTDPLENSSTKGNYVMTSDICTQGSLRRGATFGSASGKTTEGRQPTKPQLAPNDEEVI